MFQRHRRLRKNDSIRSLIRENSISINDIICPIFVVEGEGVKREILSMPGMHHFSLDTLNEEIQQLVDLGIQAIMLFGVPDTKDKQGSQADDVNGITQRAIRQIKKEFPMLYVIADTCLCSYTVHGHCGIVKDAAISNELSLERLVKTAISQAAAGADMLAPSNMMDGFVGAIRHGLDSAGYEYTPIISHAVKYASSFYGPFRNAADCAPTFGDRRSYQMDPANAREAVREVSSDIAEGADIIMVKPGLPYLDIICRLRSKFTVPIAAYNVSGEYAMLKAAANNGWLDEKAVVLETMLSFKRAGADLIVTYHAKDVARWLKEG